MTFKEYQKLQTVTCASLGSHVTDVSHMTLGIVGEWQEMKEALTINDFIKECGDVIWYVAGLANFYNLDLNPKGTSYTDNQSIAWIAEHVKKYLAYGRPVDNIYLQDHLNNLVYIIQLTLWGVGTDLETCLQTNIDKLRKRYPDGFNQEDALAKKDENE